VLSPYQRDPPAPYCALPSKSCVTLCFRVADDDVRLARRIQRDVADRGRDVVGVIEQVDGYWLEGIWG
jgi:hypothetical protein